MRWSATKLRWLTLGGFLLLAVVVAGFFGLARYKAGLIWQRILARNGVHLQRETDGFTYSQSSRGRTVFTLHASKAKPEGKGKWMLQDAVLILYGREPGRDDRIYGKQFEYDQDAGVLRALGEVHLDLETPEPGGKPPAAGAVPALTFGTDKETPESPGVIHVQTSGLVYMRKLGIAATGQPTEFRYGGLTCTSIGAEFDTAGSVVRLLADVHLSGPVHNGSFSLIATHVELNQRDNTARLAGAVFTSGDRTARAAETLLHLHKDGTMQAAEADGSVELRRGTEAVAAPEMTANFAQGNRPEHARMFTGVRFSDRDRARPAQGTAGTLDLQWLANGDLESVVASRDVSFAQSGPGHDGATVRRQLRAERAVASFASADDGERHVSLRRLDLSGGAQAGTTTSPVGPGAQAEVVQVSADRLLTDFTASPGGRPQAEKLQGTGHTRLEQTQASGAWQRSTGDLLTIAFGSSAAGAGAAGNLGRVSTVVQTGRVEVGSWAAAPARTAVGVAAKPPEVTTGHAARAVFAESEGTLTLSGEAGQTASLGQGGGELAGGEIVLHQSSGDAEATGSVVATNAGRDGSPATHILASHARLLHGAGLSTFYGDAKQPAQLWQGGSQVQAAEITLDEKTHGLSARPAAAGGLIHAVFAAGERPAPGVRRSADPAGKPPSAAAAPPRRAGSGTERGFVRMAAERMDYDDVRREAVFAGDVRVSGATGDVAADRGTAFLEADQPERPAGAAPASASRQPGAPELGGRLDRVVMAGNVRLSQPGRTGTGEQLTYVAATDSFVLTGTAAKPPRVTGGQGSLVTGATLLFRSDDSTIVVAGAKGERDPGGPKRVHAETDLR